MIILELLDIYLELLQNFTNQINENQEIIREATRSRPLAYSPCQPCQRLQRDIWALPIGTFLFQTQTAVVNGWVY